MSHNVIKNKSSIAWFNLERFSESGEKERALGLYRLLAHSLHNEAYSLQLEGDILWSFKDKAALEKYRKALDCYYKANNLVAAAAILERLWYDMLHEYEYAHELSVLYKKLGWSHQLDALLKSFESFHACGKIDQTVHEKLKNIVFE